MILYKEESYIDDFIKNGEEELFRYFQQFDAIKKLNLLGHSRVF